MNPDGYNFLAYCEQCKEKRSVCCSVKQAATGEPVKVLAIVCDHSWSLTQAQSQRLREEIAEFNEAAKRVRPENQNHQTGYDIYVDD